MKRLSVVKVYWMALFLVVPILAVQAAWMHPVAPGLTASDDSKGGFGG